MKPARFEKEIEKEKGRKKTREMGNACPSSLRWRYLVKRKKYWVLSLALSLSLVAFGPLARRLAKAQAMDSGWGMTPSSRIVGDRTITVQTSGLLAGFQNLWISCGVTRGGDGVVQRDPAFDAGATDGAGLWQGGISFQKVGPYTILMASRSSQSLAIEGGVVMPDGLFILRDCRTDAQGNLIFCGGRTEVSSAVLFTFLEQATSLTGSFCAARMPGIIASLTPHEKAKISARPPLSAEGAVRGAASFLQTLIQGGPSP
jgi:hypothetical protein